MSALGAALGLVAAVGILLVGARLPAVRAPRLHDRLAPYLREPRRSGVRQPALLAVPSVDRFLAPLLANGAARLDRVLGGSASVRLRLARAGRDESVDTFRVLQLVWGVGGLLAGMSLSVLLILRGSTDAVSVLVVCAAGTVGGVVACDQQLTRQVRRREERMLAELPTVADLLALAVAAGESPAGALERVVAATRGELAAELGRALDDVRLGMPLTEALDRAAERSGVTAFSRFVDGIAVAVERGTPLADVLRAQAADVRDARKRALLEIGGRKEIAMLVPVVFLVLPVTVVFALYPGLAQIQAVVP
jgi:tight adherence protein C